jgi:trimethylamine--corrinoid protein Co-methyltransferase
MQRGVKSKFRLNVLSKEQIERIHEATLVLLERTGVRFDSEDAVARLLARGASRHDSRKNVLTFPRGLVEESLKKIPRYLTCYGRDPQKDVRFDGETTFSHTEGGNPNMLDMESSVVRMATVKDVQQATALADALENCHTVTTFVVATDVPGPLVVMKTMEAIMRNTSKPLSGYALKKDEVDFLFRMGSSLAGGDDAFRKRPLVSVYGSPSSPMTYDAMSRSAELGIPVDIVPCPICGGTAPQTLAGGLAQQNAETLGGIMLVQATNDKIPVSYSGRLTFLDPRTGRNIWGLPEMALTSAATVQMAHRYGLAADVYGVTADASSWGTQLGIERMMMAVVPALAGADGLSGIGGLWNNACSFEMMMIDHEIYSQVFRILQGIEVDDDTLALDIIDKVGAMGNFMGQMHTLNHLRKGELRLSPLFDKRPYEKAANDPRFLHENARARIKKLLAEHTPAPLDRDQNAELTSIAKEAERKLLGKE